MSTIRLSPTDSIRPSSAPADEDHVDVAHVVQLARAGLAHPDHGEAGAGDLLAREQPGARSPTRHPGARDAQRCLQRGAGGIRESRRDERELVDRRGAQQVVRRDRGEQLPVADPQRHPRRVARVGGESVLGAHGRQQRLAQLLRGRERPARADEMGELLGMAQIEVGEPRRRAQQRPERAPAARRRRAGRGRMPHPGARSRVSADTAASGIGRTGGRSGQRVAVEPPAAPASSTSSASASASRLNPIRARWVSDCERSLVDIVSRCELRASRGCSSARSASPASGTPATPCAC